MHRGTWCALTATATKSKSKLFLQNNSFLVNKQTFLEKLHSLQLGHLSPYLDTCSNPLKTHHGIKSLPPNTCHNLREQRCAMPEVSSSREPQPSWHGFTSSINLAGGGWSEAAAPHRGPHLCLQRGLLCPGCCQSQHISQALNLHKRTTTRRSYRRYLELTLCGSCLARLFQQTCKRDAG